MAFTPKFPDEHGKIFDFLRISKQLGWSIGLLGSIVANNLEQSQFGIRCNRTRVPRCEATSFDLYESFSLGHASLHANRSFNDEVPKCHCIKTVPLGESRTFLSSRSKEIPEVSRRIILFLRLCTKEMPSRTQWTSFPNARIETE